MSDVCLYANMSIYTCEMSHLVYLNCVHAHRAYSQGGISEVIAGFHNPISDISVSGGGGQVDTKEEEEEEEGEEEEKDEMA